MSGIRILSIFLVLPFQIFLVSQEDLIDFGLKNETTIKMALQEGIKAKEAGDYEGAAQAIERILKSAQNQHLLAVELSCLLSLGDLYWLIGKIDDSLSRIEGAKLLAQELEKKDLAERCEIVLTIQKYYKAVDEFVFQNNLGDARLRLEDAIRMARKIRSHSHEIRCLRLMSVIFLQANDLDKFLYFNEEALTIANETGSLLDQAKCLNNIGAYYFKTANYSKSLATLEEALSKINNLKGNELEMSNCLSNIGLNYMFIGKYEKSLEYLYKALSIDRQIGDERSIALDILNIGNALINKGKQLENERDIIEALNYFIEANKISHKNGLKREEIKSLINIGFAFSLLKNNIRALEFLNLALNNALKLNDFNEMSIIYINLGNVYLSQGDLSKAKKYYRWAIDYALRVRSLEVLWESYFGLGECYERERNFQLAKLFYLRATENIDQIRRGILIDINKASFTRDKTKVYEALIRLLFSIETRVFSTEDNDNIFRTIEKAKARAFLEGLSEASVDVLANSKVELREQEQEISKRIALTMYELSRPGISSNIKQVILKKLEQEEDEYMRLISRMRSGMQQLVPLASLDVCSLSQIQHQLLNEDTAIIEYNLGEETSVAIFITKEVFEWHSVPPRKEIESSLIAYLRYLSVPNVDKKSGFQASQRLFNELIFPFNKILDPSIKNLIIIPDGALYMLPFETLMLPSRKSPKKIEYLINRLAISYAPSCSALYYIIKNQRVFASPKKLLAFGNPFHSHRTSDAKINGKSTAELIRENYLDQGFDFSSLPYSKKEVYSISRFFSKKNKNVYIEAKAKEEVIKEADLECYQIIHFACHGLLDEQFPPRSALVLSLDNDPIEDGFLQVREIYNMRMAAELVILSACQTGKGRVENGEGVLGLPRIFFFTGVRSVISALWKINDRSTSIFMEKFYRFLAQGQRKIEALRLAKIEMIKSRYSHPYYWAAFILNGDFDQVLSLN